MSLVCLSLIYKFIIIHLSFIYICPSQFSLSLLSLTHSQYHLLYYSIVAFSLVSTSPSPIHLHHWHRSLNIYRRCFVPSSTSLLIPPLLITKKLHNLRQLRHPQHSTNYIIPRVRNRIVTQQLPINGTSDRTTAMMFVAHRKHHPLLHQNHQWVIRTRTHTPRWPDRLCVDNNNPLMDLNQHWNCVTIALIINEATMIKYCEITARTMCRFRWQCSSSFSDTPTTVDGLTTPTRTKSRARINAPPPLRPPSIHSPPSPRLLIIVRRALAGAEDVAAVKSAIGGLKEGTESGNTMKCS